MTPQHFIDDSLYRRWVYNASPDDARYWTDYFRRHPGQRENAEIARAFLLTIRGDLPVIPDDQIRTTVGQLLAGTRTGTVRRLPMLSRWRTVPVRVAASVAVLVLAGVTAKRWYDATHPVQTRTRPTIGRTATAERTEVINRQNTPQLIRLADGSLVILQPNARLRYPRSFHGPKRDVQLIGDAFFDVVKNPARPFRVFTGLLTTEVLGTSFSIHAPVNGPARVLVKTGRVQVSANSPAGQTSAAASNATNAVVVLRPNEQASFAEGDAYPIKHTVVRATPRGISAGASGFAFRRTPLPAVLEALERAYGIPIQYDRSVLATCTLTARLDDGTLFDKLAIIAASTGSSYELLNGRLIIHSPGCR